MRRLLMIVALAGCHKVTDRPRYVPFYSEVTGTYVVASPCDWIPLVRHDGVVIGCLHGGR